MTNTALKGIIGIAAMGKISSYAGVSSDASNLTVDKFTTTVMCIVSDGNFKLLEYCSDVYQAMGYLDDLIGQVALIDDLWGR